MKYCVHYSEEKCEVLEGTEQEIREAAIEKAHELHVDTGKCWSEEIDE